MSYSKESSNWIRFLGRLDNNDEIDIRLGDDDDLDVPDAESYIHIVKMTHMCWRQTNIIDSLEFSVLSHLQYTLRIASN